MDQKCQLFTVCSASDIWSVGCTVIEMVTGSMPFEDQLLGMNPYQIMHKVANNTFSPKIPSNVSPKLHDFIQQCLNL
jgi:serine/threonine protein kinase